MDKLLLLFTLLNFSFVGVKAQTLARIHVNLYTDSLKRGTYNYINIDGELPNGRFIPLDSVRLHFSASAGTFHGNALWLDPDSKEDRINITVYVKDKTELQKSFVVYVKRSTATERLRTEQEILDDMKTNSRKKKA